MIITIFYYIIFSFIIVLYTPSSLFFLLCNSRPKTKKVSNINIVNIEGISYEIRNKEDVIQKTLLNGKQWSSKILELLKSRMKQKGHFVNVGAHIGTITLPMSKFASRVSAFEPFPKTFDHLKKNVELNKLSNVDIYNMALGDKHESVFFMDDNNDRLKNNNGGMHVFTSNDLITGERSASIAKIENLGIVSMPLDNMNLDKIDLMLVDIEGMEDKFLIGAKQTLEKDLPDLVIEIWNDDKRKEENIIITRQQIIDKILSFGYNKVEKIDDEDFLFTYNNSSTS
jgi:FkbM family methyltransferase